jgi:hypothetical protein
MQKMPSPPLPELDPEMQWRNLKLKSHVGFKR